MKPLDDVECVGRSGKERHGEAAEGMEEQKRQEWKVGFPCLGQAGKAVRLWYERGVCCLLGNDEKCDQRYLGSSKALISNSPSPE